ncbi:unnamed protein product [Rotaria sordida]|uniref:Uncharacterized protein n=1 Tax=Rotaria sordida TaxID=392033 RepID=A0A814JVR9_9BILA|nr:unnamed protein product [Rotaria sordida]CAF4076048.1 unnamed protein product [Rotaria sordida]
MVPTPSLILPPASPTISSSSTPSLLPRPSTLPSQSPAAQVPILGPSAQLTSSTITKDTLSTPTKVMDRLNISYTSSILDEVRVCTINRKTESSEVIKLRRRHRKDLDDIDMELKILDDEFKLVQVHIKGTDDEIKLAERQKEQVKYQQQLAEMDMEMAEVKRRNAEIDKYTYERKAFEINQEINQARAFRISTNQKWLDLINERLRQD